MRISIFFLLILFLVQLHPLLAKHATVELSLAQVDWNSKTKELQFDLELKAVDKPFYLSFSDIVVAIPKSNLDMTALGFDFLPGTTQLLNLGKELISFPGIRTKIKSGTDTVFFLVQLMPNQFTDFGDFFEQSVMIGTTAGQSRVARFNVTGVLQRPQVLKPHFSPKGLSSLILAFDPKDNFKAVELSERWQASYTGMEPLKFFELKAVADELAFLWKWQSPKQSWQLWESMDGDNWTLLKEGNGGSGLNLSIKNALDGSQGSFKLYRLTFKDEKNISRSVYRYYSF